MNTLNTEKINVNQRDIDKGQKIVAAIYLLTNHLSDTDPIRQSLRKLAIAFVEAVFTQKEGMLVQLETLLGAASLAGLMSEKNISILVYEAKRFYSEQANKEILSSVFVGEEPSFTKGNSLKDIKRTQFIPQIDRGMQNVANMSYRNNHNNIIVNKESRHTKILSFINEKKSVVIKDIVSLFPEVSEKTIQRELNTLISEGKITKRGSKRWSIYMAVSSLL